LKTYITWVKTTVNNFFVSRSKYKDYITISGVPVVFNALFRLTISCSILEVIRHQVEKLSKTGSEFSRFWAPKFLTQNHKLHSLSNMWESLGPLRLYVFKKEEKHQQQNIMACPYDSKAAIIRSTSQQTVLSGITQR